jgi:hypothetical protein
MTTRRRELCGSRDSEENAMTENAGTPIDTVVEAYFQMWNDADADRRRKAIETAWVDPADYLDPMFAAAGHDGLAALVAEVRDRFPGTSFRLTDPIDSHHDRARWGWELVGPDGGAALAAGVDFAELAPDGRLRAVTGFFAT